MLGLMSFYQVFPYLEEAVQLGVKEFYFTGGEPFINPDLPRMLEATLQIGPATVLTNATLFSAQLVKQLAALRDASRYSLELRVSIDGFSSETNDPIRGPGTFKRAMWGVRLLLDGGFLPVITAMRSWPIAEDEAQLGGFKNSLAKVGYRNPHSSYLAANWEPSFTGNKHSVRCAARPLGVASFGSVCFVGADSPTLPRSYLAQMVGYVSNIEKGVALGPSADGGYYAIGLKTFMPRLFEEIDWSTDRVFEQTMARIDELAIPRLILPEWYDVDDWVALRRLYAELSGPGRIRQPGYLAIHTQRFLAQLPFLNEASKAQRSEEGT